VNLLIRADASAEIGTGHVMRCLALAQAWQDQGGAVTFLMADSAPALEKRLQAEQMAVIHHPAPRGDKADSTYAIEIAQSLKTDRIVVDGYYFGATYQHTLKEAGLKVLFIDDNGHAEHYYADWVLNQNIHAHEGLYPRREPYTQLLLGTSYVMLRKEFWPWRGWQRQISPVAHKVLVTLGGSDSDNVTLKIMRALKQVERPNLEVIVVVGGSNLHWKVLQAESNDSSVKFDVRCDVANMPELMAAADVAISGGGTTCLELAFMGVPSILLSLAENQRANTRGLAALHQAIDLGSHQAIKWQDLENTISSLVRSQEQREKMSGAGKQIVDGGGVNDVIRNFATGSITLKLMEEGDCQLVWQWSNDSRNRAASFTSNHIPWIEHFKWFTSKLKDPSCLFFMVLHTDSGIPIGQVRYEISCQEATISLSIAESFRGQGYGCPIILQSCHALKQRSSVRLVNAYIKPDNSASIKVFSKSGFRCVGEQEIKTQKALRLVKKL